MTVIESFGMPSATAVSRLALLGGFSAAATDGTKHELPTRKSRLLLAYLAVPAGFAHSRSRLAALFWPDRAEAQARASLRNALSALRAVLPAGAIETSRSTVRLVPGFIDSDVARLEALSSELPGDFELQDGLALSGELLAGIDVHEGALEDWLTLERTRCRGQAQRLLQAVADRMGECGMENEAVEVANALVALDPLREKSYRFLMQLHEAQGDRSSALAEFRRCRDMLWSELGVRPSRETVELAERIGGAIGGGNAAGAGTRSAGKPAAGGDPEYNLSIAVLPFSTPTDDPDQRFFSDGMCEDVIQKLSRQKDFSVIARQSSHFFGDDGTAAAARGLDVRYVLTGSVLRWNDRVRIGVQLIDAAGDRCVWADRYDRRVSEIFDVQDDIVWQIVGTIDAAVRGAERERAARKSPASLDAWGLFHKGLWHAFSFTPADAQAADENFVRAIEAAPDFALPHAGRGYICLLRIIWSLDGDIAGLLADGMVHARRALSLDPTGTFSLVVLGRLLTIAGKLDEALNQLRLACDLNPSFAQAHFGLAQALLWVGRPAEAVPLVERAIRLSPRDPFLGMFLTLGCFCHFYLGQLEEAEEYARKAMAFPGRENWSRLGLAAVLVETGRVDQARQVISQARRANPAISMRSVDAIVVHAPDDIRQRVYSALAAAGLD